MSNIKDIYSCIADVNLWLKVRAGDTLMLSDVPAIIPLRWAYFRDNWNFIKQSIVDKMEQAPDPDFLKKQVDDFTKFIDAQRSSTSKVNPFQDATTFHRFYSIFDFISIESIELSNEEIKLVESEVSRVKIFSKNDFLSIKKKIVEARDRMADTLGLDDDDYNASYSRSSIPKQINPTIVDVNYLLTLHNFIKTLDFILSNLFAVDAVIDPFALARANANNPEIDIGQYKSGRLVRLNYGEDLESLASRYLGDPNKWIDIAIANGLKPPYIDEVGKTIPLLSNGSGNLINLAETDAGGNLNIDKFYINQPVFLRSNTQVNLDQRTVVNIVQVPVSGEIILELDGPANLDIYKIADNATVTAFAPNTANSMFYILIPSTDPLPDDRADEVPWFLAKSPEDEKRAKVDIAIDEKGDLILTPNSDIRLSYGLDNAVQAIKLKMITELGSLRYHPDFGLVNVLGHKNIDVDELRNMLVESITSQVQADSRFDRVESLSVEYLANSGTNQGVAAIAISMSVRLAGGNKVIPISFTVNTN